MENENQMKKCKHCKTEIPKDAKVCPNCRKKQGGKLKWVITAVVVIGVIGAALGGGEDKPKKVGNIDEANQADSQENIAEEQEVFHIGETAELNDVRVTMTNYEESNGSEYNAPSDGNVFILVEFEIENNSDSELAVSSALSFEAYSDDYALDYSLQALLEKGSSKQLDGSIAPGKKMKGVVGYEVPSDWKNLEIHFKDDVWSSNKFKFEISK